MRRAAPLLVGVLLVSLVATGAETHRTSSLAKAEGDAGISGRVTDTSDGSGIEGIQVHIYELGAPGIEVAILWTDVDGYFASEDPLSPGVHFARTVDTLGFVDEIFDGLPCPFSCNVEDGTQIVVAEGEVSVADFGLDPAASISGTVESSVAEPSAIADAEIMFFDLGGAYQTSAWSDGGGAWDTGAIFPAGTFFARVSRAEGHLGELYDDFNCPFHPASCDPTTGTPIEVASGDILTGHDFVLDPGGTISGEVTDTFLESGVSGAALALFNLDGIQVSTAFSEAGGIYSSDDGLVPGTYFVLLNDSGFSPLIEELYDDLWCPDGCDPTAGTPVPVTAAETVVDIDFNLERFGAVSGRLVAQDTGEGIPNSYVEIYDLGGGWVATATEESGSGMWITEESILPGQYYARSVNPGGYIDQVYDGIDCFACDVTTGTPFGVDSGAVTGDIDFVLERGSSISGLVTDANGFGAIPNVAIGIFDTSGVLVTATGSDGSGRYQTEAALAAGTYLIQTYNELGYIEKVWNDVVCNGCDITQVGTPLEVPAATDVTDIDFVLFKGASIAGRVTVAGTEFGVDSVLVGIFDDNGQPVTSAVADGIGNYVTEAVLAPGFYRAMTVDSRDFLPELYQEIPCAFGCEIMDGDAIDLGPAQALVGIDFTLELGGWISGTVVDAVNSNPIEGIEIGIYDSTGVLVTGATSDFDGNWECDPVLPSGDYYVATVSSLVWLDQLHDGVACEDGCDVTSGLAVAVAAETGSAGIAFVMEMDPVVFTDGFESGDLNGWSGVQ